MKCTNFKHILALLTYDLKLPVFEQEALKKWKMEPRIPCSTTSNKKWKLVAKNLFPSLDKISYL